MKYPSHKDLFACSESFVPFDGMLIALADQIQPSNFASEAICMLASLDDKKLSNLALANFLFKRKPMADMLTEAEPYYLELESGKK
jgi:hypothetical protein